MFVPRSVRRIRFARIFFLLAGVLPCACLVAWAVHLRSGRHRESLRAGWQVAVGLPLQVAGVEHPRPGVVRVRGCRLAAEDGGESLTVPLAEIESTPGEVRLRVDRLDVDAAAVGVAVGLAAEWLAREARFPRDCVIDVDRLHWDIVGWSGRGRDSAAGRLRIECVARDGSRAIRCTLAAGDERPAEVRVVRSAPGPGGVEPRRHEIAVECGAAPLPLAIVSRLAEAASLPPLPLGSAAAVRGTGLVQDDGGIWSGRLTGRIDRLDLAATAAAAGGRAAGEADMLVRRLEWEDGRIASAEFEVVATGGQMSQGLLEASARATGCGFGVGFFNARAGGDVRFDAAGVLLRIDGRGLEILAPAGLQGAVAVLDGRPVVEPPAAIVPLDRVVGWLTALSGGRNASRQTARIQDLLPLGPQAVRPAHRRGF